MTLLRPFLLALVLAAASLGASAQTARDPRLGPYVIAAGGAAQYDYDCWYWSDCETARGTFVKLGGGYRFGVWGLEGWYMDFGDTGIRPAPDRLQMRAGALNGVWYLPFGSQVEGLLRAGVADVRHTRSRDFAKSTFSGLFGLGLVIYVAPSAAIELGWDVTGGEGENSGSTVGSALSLGLRVRF